jgi:hypothetical protein
MFDKEAYLKKFDKKAYIKKYWAARRRTEDTAIRQNGKLTSFLLHPQVHKRLIKRAATEGISMGRAIREAVDIWLKEKLIQRRKGGPMKG